MNTEQSRPEMTLADALRVAAHKNQLDEACRILQDTLGVTDGGLAGVVFSDIDDDPTSDDASWRKLSLSERRERLVSYLKSEIDLLQNPGEGPEMSLPGFAPWHTGGGCMALAKHLPDGSYWLVTADDGTSIPREGDHILVGHHGADGETIIFEADYAWSDFDRDLFLARVGSDAPSQANGDRDGKTDKSERPAIAREQVSGDEQAFEAFKQTRRQMSAQDFGDLIGDAMWEDDPDLQFLVYDDQWWIQICEDGRHMLVLENCSWVTGPDTDLEQIERELFNFSRSS